MWTLAVLMSLSTCGVHEFCREKFQSFSCPSSVLVNMIYCSVKYCCSNSSIPGVILYSIMKSIKTPNHPAYHWSKLWLLEVWVRWLYNSWWFCVHKLYMFIHLSMRIYYLWIYDIFGLFACLYPIYMLTRQNWLGPIFLILTKIKTLGFIKFDFLTENPRKSWIYY